MRDGHAEGRCAGQIALVIDLDAVESGFGRARDLGRRSGDRAY